MGLPIFRRIFRFAAWGEGRRGWNFLSMPNCSDVSFCDLDIQLLILLLWYLQMVIYNMKVKASMWYGNRTQYSKVWTLKLWCLSCAWGHTVHVRFEILTEMLTNSVFLGFETVQTGKGYRFFMLFCCFVQWPVTCMGSAIICQLIVHLLVIVQNNKRCTVQVLK